MTRTPVKQLYSSEIRYIIWQRYIIKADAILWQNLVKINNDKSVPYNFHLDCSFRFLRKVQIDLSLTITANDMLAHTKE